MTGAASGAIRLAAPGRWVKIMAAMVKIDGSRGEGGGQILRTALALSAVTGTPFQIERIRAGRSRPGLMRQHVTAARAAAAVCGADIAGDEPGSSALRFEPGPIRAGDYHFAVGTAGSATLVFQTILPALLQADAPSRVVLEGGTHNPAAPPFDFVARCFLPQLAKMGGRVGATLERPGFYPAGGGRFTVAIEPSRLSPLVVLERGSTRSQGAEARVAGLSPRIADRELDAIARALGWDRHAMRRTILDDAHGPGNVVMVAVERAQGTLLVTGFGERGASAETVATRVAQSAARYLAADVPVGEHLAAQLVLLMALAGGGSIRTLAPSLHTRTQADLVPLFLQVDVRIAVEGGDRHRIDVVARPSSSSI